MAKGMLVMEAVGDEELYAYLKLRFLRAVWQPAWRSCQPLSAQRSSLLPCLHCPFHPHCASLSWSSTFSSCPELTVRICSTPTCPSLPRDQVYVQLGGGDPLYFSAQPPACWHLPHISAGRAVSNHGN